MQTQCVLFSSQENKKGWELQDGINMNSKIKVQNEVNLHTKKKKAINHLIQNGAWTHHGQSNSKTHHNLDLGKAHHFLLYNIFYDWW